MSGTRSDSTRSDSTRTAARWAGGLIVLAIVAAAIGAALRDDSTGPVATGPVVETSLPGAGLPTPETTTVATGADTTTTALAGPLPCPPTDGTATRVTAFSADPPMCLTPGVSYSAVLNTSEGTILVGLDAAGAPRAVNSFVYLARYRFFDGLTFHRVVPDYLIQSGSPDGTDEGGPGYTIDAEAGSQQLGVGDVAMTQVGPGTNGSQFFIVTGDLGGAVSLSGTDFAQLGRVRNGLDVVKKIDALGVDPLDGQPQPPTRAIRIDTVEIREEQASTDTTVPATTA